MITREQALVLVRKYIKTENTVKHMIATEAIMKALAQKFEPEKESEWGMAGLLHDLDYEQFTDKNYSLHGQKTVELLKTEGVDVPESVNHAILAHCYGISNEISAPQNKMEWSIFICDSLTGLIVATALVRPDRKLASVEVKSVMKKFKNVSFAAGTRREDIKLCQDKLGIPLEEFVGIGLAAMQKISSDLGL
jgi:hypothetical protein